MFIYIYTFLKIRFWVYIRKLEPLPSEKDHVHVYVYKCKKSEICLYTISETLCKNQDNLHYVFICKKKDTSRYAIFHEIVEIGIYIQKTSHFALHEHFTYSKRLKLHKNQDNLRCVLYTKSLTICVTQFLMEF